MSDLSDYIKFFRNPLPNKWDFLHPQALLLTNFFKQIVDNNKTAYYFIPHKFFLLFFAIP